METFELLDRKAVLEALYEADAITMRGVEIINQFPPAVTITKREADEIEYEKDLYGFKKAFEKDLHLKSIKTRILEFVNRWLFE